MPQGKAPYLGLRLTSDRGAARKPMRTSLHALRVACAALAVLSTALLAACATSPATGERIFTGGMSESQESQIGAEQHPLILQEFGGAYQDAELQSYVSSVGDLLAKTSERPDLKFPFTVLDSPIVNAFALPGGYVYIPRGLLALANDEAEMAGVLAHEIGHVTARHAAQRQGATLGAGIVQMGLGLLLGGNAAQLGGSLAQPLLQSYSREQEFEADMLGVRYLRRAGYDSRAMSDFLVSMEEEERLRAQLAGNPEAADQFNIMSSHPRTADRVEAAAEEAGTAQPKDPIEGREIYLSKIDGIIYGDSPAQGYARGRVFSHPELRFRFEVPQGFRLTNLPSQVVATNQQGDSQISFDMDKVPSGASLESYLINGWGQGMNLRNGQRFTVNGRQAVTATTRGTISSGQSVDLRLVAFRADGDQVYRFAFITPAGSSGRIWEQTIDSFRTLSAAEASALKPYRLDVYTVRRGDTVASLARRLPFDDLPEERLRVINGIEPGQPLPTGMEIKLIK